jgi:hypothetical protein
MAELHPDKYPLPEKKDENSTSRKKENVQETKVSDSAEPEPSLETDEVPEDRVDLSSTNDQEKDQSSGEDDNQAPDEQKP